MPLEDQPEPSSTESEDVADVQPETAAENVEADDDEVGEGDGDEDANENGEDGDEDEDEDEDEEEDEDEDEEEEEEPAVDEKPKSSPRKKKKLGVLEYDIHEMYPEIDLLVQNKRSQWNYNDSDTIRAIWLENKTNILADWKVRNSKIDFKKTPDIEVKDNLATSLRKEVLGNAVKKEEWYSMYIPPGNDPPVYKSVQLPTNVTMEVRYNFVRNNPPVPSSYVHHFQKYKKPPFNLYQPRTCRLMKERCNL